MVTENQEETNGPEETQEVEQVEEEIKVSPHEERARADGWVPKEEWVEAGHNGDEWRGAKDFNDFGDIINTVKTLQNNAKNSEKAVNDRIKGLNKIHSAQMEGQLKQLKAQRSEDVKNGDEKAHDNTQAQIDDLERAARESNKDASSPVDNNEVNKEAAAKWIGANQWINERSAKTVYATAEYDNIMNEGLVGDAATAELNKRIAFYYPEQNERRNNAPRSEAPRKANTSKPKSLTMGDLQPHELRAMSLFKDSKGNVDEKRFLKSVKDSRA